MRELRASPDRLTVCQIVSPYNQLFYFFILSLRRTGFARLYITNEHRKHVAQYGPRNIQSKAE